MEWKDSVVVAQYSQALRLHEPPTALKWFTVLSNITMPYILYVAAGSLFSFSFGFRHSVIFSIVDAAITVWLYAFGLLRGVPEKATLWTALGTSLVLQIAWMSIDGFTPFAALFVPFVAYAMFRVKKLLQAESASWRNRSMFRTDTIILTIFVPLQALASRGIHSSGLQTSSESVALITTLYALARIYSLWRFERIETNTKGASRIGFVMLFSAALILAMWGPFLVFHVFYTLVAVIAPLALLTVALLQRLGLHASGRRLKAFRLKPTTPVNKHPHPPVYLSQHDTLILAIVVGVLLAAGFLVVMVRSRKTRSKSDVNPEETHASVSIHRTWMFWDKGLRFLSTTDPVRLRYQAWITKQVHNGNAPHLSETPKQFSRRVRSEDEEADGITSTYEMRRYSQESGEAKSYD